MARLQRKKPPHAKKKKKSAGLEAGSEGRSTGDAVTSKVMPMTGPKSTGVPKKAPTQSKASAGGRDGIWHRSIQFLREVKVELKKVTWPSRKQTLGSTVVVIILVTIISFFLGAVDIGLSSLVKVILQ
jgi:preprotein translocase subunit SecE